MKLTNLKDSLLTKIISYFDVPHNRENLFSIAQASRKLKELAYPFLWRLIDIRMERVDNAAAVQYFTNNPTYKFEKLREVLSGKVVAKDGRNSGIELRGWVKSLKVSLPDFDWYFEQAVYLPLMSRLPELQTLSMDPPPRHLETPPNMALESARINFRFFGGASGKERSRLRVLRELASVPSLRILQIQHDIDESTSYPDTNRPFDTTHRGFSSVEDLRLIRYHETRSEVVPGIVSWPRVLKRMILDLPFNCYPTIKSLMPALEVHKYSLEAFCLFAPTWEKLETTSPDEADSDFNDTLAKWDFTHFVALKKLALPFYPFMTHGDEHSILPAQLKFLQLQHSALDRGPRLLREWHREDKEDRKCHLEDSIREKFKQLFKIKAVGVPALQNILWWYQVEDGNDSVSDAHRENLEEIEMMAWDVNVEFEYLTAQSFKDTALGEVLLDWD
ncbi:MAG: hypothetical protein Q9164_001910 [Protoblastenia rupestris]